MSHITHVCINNVKYIISKEASITSMNLLHDSLILTATWYR